MIGSTGQNVTQHVQLPLPSSSEQRTHGKYHDDIQGFWDNLNIQQEMFHYMFFSLRGCFLSSSCHVLVHFANVVESEQDEIITK